MAFKKTLEYFVLLFEIINKIETEIAPTKNQLNGAKANANDDPVITRNRYLTRLLLAILLFS